MGAGLAGENVSVGHPNAAAPGFCVGGAKAAAFVCQVNDTSKKDIGL